MTQRSAAATDAARRLWARAAGAGSGPEEVAADVARVCSHLRVGLGRWIGSEGYQVLLDRALGLARVEHPALTGLACLGGDEPVTTAAVRANGAGKVTAGLVALVAALIDLLGRMIGEEMAVRLVEQIGIPSPHEVVSIETKEGRDG
jgi:hypothetical protein